MPSIQSAKLAESSPPVDKEVLALLRSLARTSIGRRFYLAGGTALALQIGHRQSNDLDYFTDADMLDRQALWRWIDQAKTGNYQVVNNESRQVDLLMGEHRFKVSFIAYPFPLLRPTVEIDGQACADVLDIAAMKAYAIGRRAMARDYVDLDAILRSGIALEDVVATARARFVLDGEPVFSERLFLQQLIYTKDVEDMASLRELSVSFAEVERSLRSLVAQYVRRRLEP